MHRPISRQRALLLLGLVLALGACSTAGGPDPYRTTNEKIFRFNEGFDKRLFAPVAEGYDKVSPGFFQTMLGNFFQNLTVPRTLVNNLLQGKPGAAVDDFGRLLANTTLGLGGLFDVAGAADLPENDEDFGQTFGRWGVGSGPYLVIPIIGPSNVRDFLSAPLDIVSNPTTWLNVFGLSVVDAVNTRAQYIEEVEQARADAVDYYVFRRDAYLSGREADIRDGEAPAGAEDDLYDLDELDEEEAEEGAETTDAQP